MWPIIVGLPFLLKFCTKNELYLGIFRQEIRGMTGLTGLAALTTRRGTRVHNECTASVFLMKESIVGV